MGRQKILCEVRHALLAGTGLFLPALTLITLVACARTDGAEPASITVTEVVPRQASAEGVDLACSEDSAEPRYGYTYHGADGNRRVDGSGSLPEISPIDIRLEFVPKWVAAVAVDCGSIWAALSAQGDVSAFFLQGADATGVVIEPVFLAAGQPPLLHVSGDDVSLVEAPADSASTATHPIVIEQSGDLIWIDGQGDLVLNGGVDEIRLFVNALPDARILQDERQRLLMLSAPTDRYDHGVLGDGIEAGTITLVETTPEFRIAGIVAAPEGMVFEGIMPLWSDLNDDGKREIIITASDHLSGARLLVYSEAGELLASSDAIGQGYRWRHQIAVASPSEGQPPEIISVRTPHIGGSLEYFRMEGERLRLIGALEGVTSHVIGTRNLDLALSGDFDGDGQIETLLPDTPMQKLVAVQRSGDDAEVDWWLPLGGAMSTNLAAVTDANGRVSIGVGVESGKLRIWSP